MVAEDQTNDNPEKPGAPEEKTASSPEETLDELSGFADEAMSDEEFLQSLSKLTEKMVDVGSKKDFQFLLKRWASFTVFVIDPPQELKLPPTKISIPNGLTIYNFGSFYVITNGEVWAEGTSCTGKLITSSKAMIDKMAENGIREISFSGYDIACFAAWKQCNEKGIIPVNYTPSIDDMKKKYLIDTVQEQGYKELLQPEPRP